MLLKIALWYVNRSINSLPTGIGHIDANDHVVWPAAS